MTNYLYDCNSYSAGRGHLLEYNVKLRLIISNYILAKVGDHGL